MLSMTGPQPQSGVWLKQACMWICSARFADHILQVTRVASVMMFKLLLKRYVQALQCVLQLKKTKNLCSVLSPHRPLAHRSSMVRLRQQPVDRLRSCSACNTDADRYPANVAALTYVFISLARLDQNLQMQMRRVPEECPAEVAAIVTACLQLVPGQRPSISQVYKALHDAPFK